jgi:hypothetical protein
MATSFISEHSVEYILVANLTETLTTHFNRVIPIYFLSTREGSIISRECGPSQVVKVVSVFARRPKVNFAGQSVIENKIQRIDSSDYKAILIVWHTNVRCCAPCLSIFDLRLDLDCACRWRSNGQTTNAIAISPRTSFGRSNWHWMKRSFAKARMISTRRIVGSG